MENFKIMTNNKYIIKNLAPWMIDELIAISKITKYEIIFLRKQDSFYKEGIQQLSSNGVGISIEPYAWNNFLRKFAIVIKFVVFNAFKFRPDYNFVIGFKSVLWFVRLDLSKFSSSSNIHAQFATQAALVSYLIKKYYNNKPQYSFTFHAHDIYFENRWFTLLVNDCHRALSISKYNIKYVQKVYLNNNKILLARLGVFRDQIKINKDRTLKENDPQVFTLGLMSWFVKKKGIIYLLNAMLKLKEMGNNNIRLLLAGDGPLKDDILNFISQNDLTNSIDYLGKLKKRQKTNFYNSIDTFVLPSISLKNDKYGIPVVLLEAIAYGLPIISTDVSGIPEICLDNFNGFLIKEKNVNSIVKSVLTLNEDYTLRMKFSENSLKVSKDYGIRRNSYEKIKTLGWLVN